MSEEQNGENMSIEFKGVKLLALDQSAVDSIPQESIDFIKENGFKKAVYTSSISIHNKVERWYELIEAVIPHIAPENTFTIGHLRLIQKFLGIRNVTRTNSTLNNNTIGRLSKRYEALSLDCKLDDETVIANVEEYLKSTQDATHYGNYLDSLGATIPETITVENYLDPEKEADVINIFTVTCKNLLRPNPLIEGGLPYEGARIGQVSNPFRRCRDRSQNDRSLVEIIETYVKENADHIDREAMQGLAYAHSKLRGLTIQDMWAAYDRYYDRDEGSYKFAYRLRDWNFAAAGDLKSLLVDNFERYEDEHGPIEENFPEYPRPLGKLAIDYVARFKDTPWQITEEQLEAVPDYYEKLWGLEYLPTDPFEVFCKIKELLGQDKPVVANDYTTPDVDIDEASQLTIPSNIPEFEPTTKYGIQEKAIKESERLIDTAVEKVNKDFLAMQFSLQETVGRVGNALAEQAKLEAMRRTTDWYKQTVDTAQRVAYGRFLKQIDEINQNNKNWFVFQDGDKGEGFVAITRSPIVYKGCLFRDGRSTKETNPDDLFTTGFAVVHLTSTQIQGIYLSGTSTLISRLSSSGHPHLRSGDAVFCMGNMADTIIESFVGKSIAVAQEYSKELPATFKFGQTMQATTKEYQVSKEYLSKMMRKDEISKEVNAELVQKLSWFYGINNLELYLNTVFRLLEEVNYESPYVRPNTDNLNKRCKDVFNENTKSVLNSEHTVVDSRVMEAVKVAYDKGAIAKESIEYYLHNAEDLHVSKSECDALKEIISDEN